VKNSEEADFRAQVPGTGGDGAQGLRRSAKENTVNHFFVLIGDGGNLFRQGEDDVEVRNGQKFRLAVFEPLGAGEGLTFGTVAISTGVEGGALVTAGVTLLQVAAQGGGAAEFDGTHHAPLSAREGSSVLLPVRRTVAAEDIRHFELRTLHGPAGSEILRCGGL
jgi:hypothetical protein